MKKVCKSCQQSKPFDAFNKKVMGKFGLNSVCRACKKQEYQKDKALILSKQQVYAQKNAQKKSEYGKFWREQNKEALRLKKAEYFQKNKQDIVKKACERRRTDVQVRLRHAVSTRLYRALRQGKQRTTEQLLGCSISELKTYLESKFQPGMTWENYGRKGWHVDHVQPLCKFDLTEARQLTQACHYTNLQPLWAAENLSKGGR